VPVHLCVRLCSTVFDCVHVGRRAGERGGGGGGGAVFASRTSVRNRASAIDRAREIERERMCASTSVGRWGREEGREIWSKVHCTIVDSLGIQMDFHYPLAKQLQTQTKIPQFCMLSFLRQSLLVDILH
jgi:hypothetical protein